MIPFACGFRGFNDFQHSLFYKTDYPNHDIISLMLDALLISKYDKHIIYAHNFSKFDAILILNSLITKGEVKDIIVNK